MAKELKSTCWKTERFGRGKNCPFTAADSFPIQIEIYSRNQEKNTSKYPDIIARMPQVRQLYNVRSEMHYSALQSPQVLKDHVKSCVIDSEAVAWDTQKKQILPFQVSV